MLKRLSGTFSQSSDQLLLPPAPISPSLGFNPSSSSSSSAPSSPHSYRSSPSQGYPFPTTTTTTTIATTSVIDRSTLHKTLSLLSNLLVALDELRSSSLIQCRAEKKLSKALKELGKDAGWSTSGNTLKKSMNQSSSNIQDALLASATMYEKLSEVDTKFAKFVQTEYESINEQCSKYFKKTAKEEKTYEDSLSSLDTKMSKATLSYQKYATKSQQQQQSIDSLTCSHSNYISTLQSFQSQVNQLQSIYSEQITLRRELVGQEVARCFTGLADKNWRNRIEGIKQGGGDVIGKVLEKGVWVTQGMERVEEFEKIGRELSREGEGEREEREKRSSDQAQPQESISTTTTREAKKNVLIRGPRAPSTSTQNTLNTTTSTSVSTNSSDLPPAPRPHSIPPSRSSPVQRSPTALEAVESHSHSHRPPTAINRIESPPRSATSENRRVSIEEPTLRSSRSPPPLAGTSSSQQDIELGGGRTLPRGWYLDPSFANHFRQQQQHQQEEAAAPLLPSSPTQSRPQLVNERRQTYDALSTRREDGNDGGVILRKPTPRYGSAPPLQSSGANDVRSYRDNEGQSANVDESGRNATGGEEERESFVRKMSQKYATGGGESKERQTTSPQHFSQAPPQNHNRSNSRVSLLAKRYSSPPDPPSSLSYPVSPNDEFSSSRRPLPAPTHRSSSSLQFQPPPPTTRQHSYTPQSLTSSHPRDFSHSSYSRSHPNLPTIPSNSDQSHASSSSVSTESHPIFCACQTCTSLHYSHNGKEELTRSEEERLQKELRVGGKAGGGTLMRGLVGKSKEVFGRMG